MSPRTGRPPKNNPKNADMHIRITPEEKAEVMNYCKEHKLTLLELIRRGMQAGKK